MSIVVTEGTAMTAVIVPLVATGLVFTMDYWIERKPFARAATQGFIVGGLTCWLILGINALVAFLR